MLLFGDEQFSLPGVPRCAQPVAPEPRPTTGGPFPQCPGQLALGPSQMLLTDADPEPLQASLLPEPPLWDLVDRPATPAPMVAGVPAPLRQLRLFPMRMPRLTA
jgi:hypothetical protein